MLSKILLYLLSGILLTLTPCSLPMIPVIMGILSYNNTLRSNSLLALIYVLGASIAYSLFGLITVLVGHSIIQYIQNPYVIGGFIVLLLYFVLVNLDIIKMKLPMIVLNTSAKGLLNVFISGFVSVLVLSPCATPVLGTILMYMMSSGDYTYGWLYLFLVGFGQGLGLIAVSLFGREILKKISLNLVKYITLALQVGVCIYLILGLVGINY